MSAYILGILTLPIAAVAIAGAYIAITVFAEWGIRISRYTLRDDEMDRRTALAASIAIHPDAWGIRIFNRFGIVVLPPIKGWWKRRAIPEAERDKFMRVRDGLREVLARDEEQA